MKGHKRLTLIPVGRLSFLLVFYFITRYFLYSLFYECRMKKGKVEHEWHTYIFLGSYMIKSKEIFTSTSKICLPHVFNFLHPLHLGARF